MASEQWRRLQNADAERMAERFERCCDFLIARGRTRDLSVALKAWNDWYPELPNPDADAWLRSLEDSIVNDRPFAVKGV